MEPILKLDKVVKRFGGLVAVNELSFEMQPREIHALIGPNGSGKTTTINLIDGFYEVNAGKILFDGKEIQNKPTHQISAEGIGRTFQNLNMFSSLTVEENLLIPGQNKSKIGFGRYLFDFNGTKNEEKRLREEAAVVMNDLGLTQYKDTVVKSLPYGRQKIVELARVIMLKPKLILLDEPAAGLNPSERAEFVDMVLRVYDSGVDILMIEHNMDVVMNISHRITVMNFGKKIAEGKPEEIRTNPEVISAYLGDKYRVGTEGAADA